MNGQLSTDRLRRGAAWFVAFTVLGWGALWVFTVRHETLLALRTLSLGFIALCFVATALDTVLGAVRYQIFLRRIRPGTSLWLPIRADLANRFTGAITPSQTGGGPAQLFVLFRGGIPVPDSLSFLAINFLSTMVFFLVAGGLAAPLFRADLDGVLGMLVGYGFLVFAVMGLFAFVALLRPEIIEGFCKALVRRMEGSRNRWLGVVVRGGDWVARSIGQYRAACTLFIRQAPMLLVWSLLLTVVLYLNKFTLGYLVLRGLGVEASYVEVIAVQALLQFLLYVAPSPGGSGIAEVVTAALMARFMEAHLLGLYALGLRFFLTYLPAALGCLVLFGVLKPRNSQPPQDAKLSRPPQPEGATS